METFCANTGRSKYRPALTNGSYYPPPYSTNFRQNEYSMGMSSRHSALLWQERPQPNSAKSKGGGKSCSIALAAAAFIVLIAVVSIAGLALYMGALRTEPASPLLAFSCSVQVLRGDRFIGNLQEKARKYKNQFEILYQRSPLSPAVVACNVEKFGNDTQTIHYRSITNIEKTIRDTLLGDALSKKPIFRNIRFDSRSVSIRLVKDQNSYQRATKPNQPTNTKLNDPPKPTAKSKVERTKNNLTIPLKSVTKKPEIQEINIEEDNLPVIQGSFQISKTDADIAVNKKATHVSSTQSIERPEQTTKKPVLKETAVTSAFFKIGFVDQVSKPTSPSRRLDEITKTTQIEVATKPEVTKATTRKTETTYSTTTTTTTRTTTHTTDINNQTNPIIVAPEMINNEPWIPIITQESTLSNPFLPLQNKQPIYTSFTNPGLSINMGDSERLGSTSLISHPLPVNKLTELTELSNLEKSTITNDKKDNVKATETNLENSSETSILATQTNDFIGNVPAFFQTLASSFTSLDFPKNISQETDIDSSSTTELFSAGQGQVEVVDAEDISQLMLQTTKLPLVTLLPVKSNSGVGKPLRRRPSFGRVDQVEDRSFPSWISNQNLEESSEKRIETEVVTFVSTEVHKIIEEKPRLSDFKISSVLNFQMDPKVLTPDNGLIRNQKMALDNIDDDDIESVVTGTNSSISIHVENQFLSAEKLKQLSEISRVSQNETKVDDVISNKAVRTSYAINHDGLKVLTKTFNKIPGADKEKNNAYLYDVLFPVPVNTTECTNYTVKCGNGVCLPPSTRCNQLIDCDNGEDEKNCSCTDYLKSQFHTRKICDGVVDCWDYSDENQCDWCSPDRYVCASSKICITQSKICDGINDCPQADDERRCVTIAPSVEEADEFTYNPEGYLLVRKFGQWGKLCVDNIDNGIPSNHWNFTELGNSVCKAITYQNLQGISSVLEDTSLANNKFFKMVVQNDQNSSLYFDETGCKGGEVLKIRCSNLECGSRPQAIKQVARIVGGINAGLGDWPWQAALYKEGEFQCGATLLSERWLISAGHCFYHTMDEHWVARLGALRRGTSLPSPYEQLRPIVRIILHPKYVDSGFVNDISLLQMDHRVTFNDYVRPICLPKEGVTVEDGAMCTVVGWGQLFETGRIFPDTLQEVQIPVISTAECRKRTIFLPLYRVTDDMFCAGFERGGRDACLGDSGGPLMCPEPDGRWSLQGVTSNGYGCARKDRPGVYTKVSNYIPWILSHVNNQNLTSATKKSVCAGHRCPLGDCLPANRLCNGYKECSDGSDEVHCFQ